MRSIGMMKHGAILLNVSRGGLVDTDEVLNALERGQIGGLGMDVWENEGAAARVLRGCSLLLGPWRGCVRACTRACAPVLWRACSALCNASFPAPGT